MESQQDNARPQNPLEELLLEAQGGKVPLSDFLRRLVSGDLFVTSVSEVKEDGSGFAPLLFERDGVPLTAVFTSPARATMHGERAKYLLQINGRELFKRLPPGYGIVLNPGHPVGMEIQPYGVEQIARDFA